MLSSSRRRHEVDGTRLERGGAGAPPLGELMAEWVSKIPLGRAGTCDDVANLLLFLGSDEASYITGQTVNVDGGMFMN
jgi:NAD(P)-dependent dehydrogenase (short-subunit alcohol dehydrogenase family)